MEVASSYMNSITYMFKKWFSTGKNETNPKINDEYKLKDQQILPHKKNTSTPESAKTK